MTAPGTKNYRKLPVVIQAAQWHVHGDHPKVVPYSASKDRACAECQQQMLAHGWVQTLEGAHIVCPGDWVITGVRGETYPCKPDVFAKTYEEAPE